MADLNTIDVIKAVQLKLSDTAFDQGMIIDAMNFFVSELYMNTRTRRMEESDVIYVNAGDTAADLPTDIQTLIAEGLFATSPNTYSLDKLYMEYGDFMKTYPKYLTDTPTAINNWTNFGNAIRFSTPVLAASTIGIDYLRKPNLALLTYSTPEDTIELDEVYKELATLGTLARCMESNEDYAEASSERNNLAPLVTAWIRNEGRGGFKTGPVIMRSNRSHPSPYSRNRNY